MGHYDEQYEEMERESEYYRLHGTYPVKTVQEVNSRSAQPCGCDLGAGHLCQQHLDEQTTEVNNWARREWGPLKGIKDSGERVTYASGSMRDPSTGKIKWSRVTFGPLLRRWAQHLTTAEAKYPDPKPGVPNFMLIETEEERMRYKESAFRHFMSWFYEETDEDHAAAVCFNMNGVAIIDEKRKAKGGA